MSRKKAEGSSNVAPLESAPFTCRALSGKPVPATAPSYWPRFEENKRTDGHAYRGGLIGDPEPVPLPERLGLLVVAWVHDAAHWCVYLSGTEVIYWAPLTVRVRRADGEALFEHQTGTWLFKGGYPFLSHSESDQHRDPLPEVLNLIEAHLGPQAPELRQEFLTHFWEDVKVDQEALNDLKIIDTPSWYLRPDLAAITEKALVSPATTADSIRLTGLSMRHAFMLTDEALQPALKAAGHLHLFPTGKRPLKFRGELVCASEQPSDVPDTSRRRRWIIRVFKTTGGALIAEVAFFTSWDGECGSTTCSIFRDEEGHPSKEEALATWLEGFRIPMKGIGYPSGKDFVDKQARLMMQLEHQYAEAVSAILAELAVQALVE